MSRGIGRRQRRLLELLNERVTISLEKLGATPAERVAYARAARTLEAKGLCLRFAWPNKAANAVTYLLVRTDCTQAATLKDISVSSVPNGTGKTLIGSVRELARELRVSKSTAHRFIRKAEEKLPHA